MAKTKQFVNAFTTDDVAFSVPAHRANMFWMNATATDARLTFIEQAPSGKTHARAAVVLSHGDAMALRDFLLQHFPITKE